MATKVVLCDTGIIIKLLRGEVIVLQELDFLGFANLAISSVTVAEIYYGMRKGEARATKSLLSRFGLFHLDKPTSVGFLSLMLEHRGRIQVPDALIAATAITQGIELFTLNIKDFDFISGLRLYRPKSWGPKELT